MSVEFTTTTTVPDIYCQSEIEEDTNAKKLEVSVSSSSSQSSEESQKKNKSHSSEKSQDKNKSHSSEKSQNKNKSHSSEKSKTVEKIPEKIGSNSRDSSESKKNKKKRSAAAQQAFHEKDAEQSIQVHDQLMAIEKHKKGADYIKSMVYGGMDGIGTAFAVVASAAGASLGAPVILALGVSTLIADGVGMGVSDFISGKAENDYAKGELKRETWEYENYPEGEKAEMVDFYTQKGLAEDEAKELVRVLALNQNNFIETMMTVELGLMPPDPNDSPWKKGLVTFISFIIFGLVPLLSFIFGEIDNSSFNTLFGISSGLTAAVLFLLGALTSRFSIYEWWQTGLVMLFVGTISSAASYGIGVLVHVLVLKFGGVISCSGGQVIGNNSTTF